MGRFHALFEVPTPPAETLAYLADYGHTAQWDPATQACDRLDGGPVVVGARWRNTSDFRGHTAVLTYELVELGLGRVRFEGAGPAATAADDFTVTPADGGSRVAYVAAIDLRGYRRLADPFLRRVYERMGAGAVEGITRALGR